MRFSSILFLCVSLLTLSACKSDPKSEAREEKAEDTPPPAEQAASEDITPYSEILEYNGTSFEVTASDNTLTVQPSGLEASNEPMETEIGGKITGAETGDLNADGWPEILVYTRSTDGSMKGNIYAFSVLNGKSLSLVNVPALEEQEDHIAGYVGGDEFQMVENTLVRRFILDDGTTRQLQYKIKEGENMRSLYIDKVVEY